MGGIITSPPVFDDIDRGSYQVFEFHICTKCYDNKLGLPRPQVNM